MAYAIPTSPCTTLLTYTELDEQFTDITGTSAGLISTVVGQRLARAADAAYWMIVNCLLRQGYTPAQITLWLAGYGHSMHQYLAVFWWGSDSGLARDHAVFADAERYRLEWVRICEEGAPIFDANGDLIIPNTDLLGAALQARASVQNNSLGKCHTNRVDADPRQFLSGNASTIVAGTHYDNPGGCC